MTRQVNCSLLGKLADGLEQAPYPGELGERIYENVSAEAWQSWLERLVMIVNEEQVNTSDARSLKLVERHMVGYLFNEGDLGQAPDGFVAK
ncbi:MAG: oxidative damage protection protein [Arenicellales bacterium]